MVQLHGDEDGRYIQQLKREGIRVIKSVNILDRLPVEYLQKLEKSVDFFLFDSRGMKRGGNGIPFPHEVLKHYSGSVPYFLSGGLTPEIVENVLRQSFTNLLAVDVNSRFEFEPGLKDIPMLKKLMRIIHKNQVGVYHDS